MLMLPRVICSLLLVLVALSPSLSLCLCLPFYCTFYASFAVMYIICMYKCETIFAGMSPQKYNIYLLCLMLLPSLLLFLVLFLCLYSAKNSYKYAILKRKYFNEEEEKRAKAECDVNHVWTHVLETEIININAVTMAFKFLLFFFISSSFFFLLFFVFCFTRFLMFKRRRKKTYEDNLNSFPLRLMKVWALCLRLCVLQHNRILSATFSCSLWCLLSVSACF